jgi:hypothetical protein
MGDDPMALLGLEGALKHYYLLLLTPHDQEPAPCVQPKPAILSPLLQVPALLLLLAIAAAVAVREAAFCLKVSL